jgi:succinate--hydroxymethylglutarate CoA-transferase
VEGSDNRKMMLRKWKMISLPALRQSYSSVSDGKPLSGIRVLDLTRILAGPYCTMLLGDLGADIIKVENPAGGDDTRKWGPPFSPHGESAYFLSVNRNKRSVAINIKHPKGVELVRKLATTVDVLVENFLPEKMDELGLGYPALRALNHRLIYCSLTGYGSVGPDSKKTGYDVMISAAGGLLGITGPKAEPAKVGVAITDITTGLYLHGAVMAALLTRMHTHTGQKIDVSLFGCQIAALANVGQNYLTAGLPGARHGTAHESIVPYQAFKASDGFLVAGALNDGQFAKLCAVLALPEGFAEKPEFKSNAQRVRNRSALLQELEALFKQKPVDAWLALLEAKGVPCSRVRSVKEAMDSEQAAALELVQEAEHRTEGKIKLTGFPVKYSDERTRPTLRRAPPTLGQDTREVLGELGLSETEIGYLVRDGVVSLMA